MILKFKDFLNESAANEILNAMPRFKKKDEYMERAGDATLLKTIKLADGYSVEFSAFSGSGGSNKKNEMWPVLLCDVYKDGKEILRASQSLNLDVESHIADINTAGTFQKLAETVVEEYVTTPVKDVTYDDNDAEEAEVSQDALDYIKKHIDTNVLKSMVESFEHPYTGKQYKYSDSDLKKATPIVDGAGLTCLFYKKTFYLYVLPIEVFEEQEFGSSDNEQYAKLKDDTYLVLVMV